MEPTRAQLTQLLRDSQRGDSEALDRLLPHVYRELRRLAQSYLKGERKGHTLQATALVHEVYLRLFDADVAWQDRVQFYKAAAQSMRRILVDSARAKRSAKRGGGTPGLSLDEGLEVSADPPADLVALDDALDDLARQDDRKAQVVQLHFFGGLNFEEIAKVLDVSVSTVTRDMTLARAWLRSAMTSSDGQD